MAIIRATGDSMAPVIEPGASRVRSCRSFRQKRSQHSASSNWACLLACDRMFLNSLGPASKFVQPLLGTLYMSSKNPAHEPFTAAHGDYEIIGAVVAIIRVLE